MLPPTLQRSERNTPESINERIRRETEERIAHTLAGGRAAIEARLRELDAEWDTERTLETMAASFTIGGLLLGVTVDRRWLWFSGLVSGFLLQHALQGFCPPLPAIRALGVRTAAEIDQERYALKAARGDFEQLRGASQPAQLLAAAIY
ncbi:MAG TPA: DUF2892 domain-containing protein [Polyangiales bacterium]|nr:DUF2892 domain-containing protein [Polyangiales bacterium]